ncbi:MAG: methyltransferase family protein [Phycisphaerales bacterium]
MSAKAIQGPAGQALLRLEHPWLFRLGQWTRRVRTEVLVVGVAIGVIEGIVERERPLDLFEWEWRLLLAGVLLAAGCVLRIAAIGCIRKNDELETRGVYSICRHPLYLGTILAYAAFCVLLDDAEFYWFGAAYFALFYTPTILWEEASLRRQYGEDFAAYARHTPALLPLGRFVPGRFAWSVAKRRGAVAMLVGVALSLISVQAMARLFRPGVWGGNDPPDSAIGRVDR